MTDPKDIFIAEADFRKRYKYSPDDLLGEGGFAQVYKAFDRQFEEFVALKFYNKGKQGKYDVLHEMKDSRSYSHKNIIRVHDARIVRFEQGGIHSYVQIGVLEFANGGNFKDFLSTEPSEEIFNKILIGILNALDYLHKDKNLIHRDLSPENILMFEERGKWIPKIADFGISKKIEYDVKDVKQKKSTQLLGKPDYMAPEQFDPGKFGINGMINTNVDLWSFGIILFEAFLQRTPFGGNDDNPMRTIHSITRDSLPVLKEIPDPYRKIVRQCLIKDARKRVQSARDIITLLEHRKKATGINYANTVPIREFQFPKRNLRKILLPLLFTLILIVGFFIVRGVLSTRDSRAKDISAIVTLMGEEDYEGALAFMDELSEKHKKDLDISLLNKECVLWDHVKKEQYNQAVVFFTSLPESVKSNPDILVPYQKASLINARDELNRLYELRNYKGANDLYSELDSKLKSDPEIRILYDKLKNEIAIDSIINAGIGFFSNGNLEESKAAFRSVQTRFDPDNQVAAAYLQRISRQEYRPPTTAPIQTPSTNLSFISTPECPIFYSGNNIKMSQKPDMSEIRLLDICFNNTEIKITLELQTSEAEVSVYDPGAKKAFFIEYGSPKRELLLRDLDGWRGIQGTVQEPTSIELIFDPLPEEISEFDLLDGKIRIEGTSYWDFIGIKLAH